EVPNWCFWRITSNPSSPSVCSNTCSPCRTSFIRIVFAFCFQSVTSFCWHVVTLPSDGNNATGRPVARGIEHAPDGGCLHSEGTAEHSPSLGDSVRHGNVRHIRSTLAAASARQRGLPCTGTPPSPT